MPMTEFVAFPVVMASFDSPHQLLVHHINSWPMVELPAFPLVSWRFDYVRSTLPAPVRARSPAERPSGRGTSPLPRPLRRAADVSRDVCERIAIYTLVVAKALRLAERPGELITRAEIEAEADRWANRRPEPAKMRQIADYGSVSRAMPSGG